MIVIMVMIMITLMADLMERVETTAEPVQAARTLQIDDDQHG